MKQLTATGLLDTLFREDLGGTYLKQKNNNEVLKKITSK